MIKVVVFAPNGKVGKAIIKAALKSEKLDLIGAYAPTGKSYIGQDLGLLCGLGKEAGVFVSEDISILKNCDIALDCSNKDYSLKVLYQCLKYNKALVCGSTGFSEDDLAQFEEASHDIPVLLAGNSSHQAHILFKTAEFLASTLGYLDVDIIETHDNQKLDAPSSTSKELAQIILKQKGIENPSDHISFGLNAYAKRDEDSILIHSIRTGQNPGEHKIIFGSEDEKIELSYSLYNIAPFAKGILDSALFLAQKEKGLFSIKDVFKDLYK